MLPWYYGKEKFMYNPGQGPEILHQIPFISPERKLDIHVGVYITCPQCSVIGLELG